MCAKGVLRKYQGDHKVAAIGEVVQDVLGSLEKSDLKKCGMIFIRWPEMAGETVASHTRPLSVRGKKLKVVVDSSDWLYEITTKYEKEIFKRVQALVGSETIQEIRYQVGTVEE